MNIGQVLGQIVSKQSPRSAVMSARPLVVYFSSVSENTHRFVQKLGWDSYRIPVSSTYEDVTEPFVLVTPTYGGLSQSLASQGRKVHKSGAVPKQVIRFLNHKPHRDLMLGVVAAGNTNFGAEYCLAGDIIAVKCQVPYMYKFELMGTPEDVIAVRSALSQLTSRAQV